jgi:hypothetical protein
VDERDEREINRRVDEPCTRARAKSALADASGVYLATSIFKFCRENARRKVLCVCSSVDEHCAAASDVDALALDWCS